MVLGQVHVALMLRKSACQTAVIQLVRKENVNF